MDAIDLVTHKSEDKRLIFTFRLYDANGSGKIDVKEMAKVIETLNGLKGNSKGKLTKVHADDPTQKTPAFKFAERMFKLWVMTEMAKSLLKSLSKVFIN